MADRAHLEPGDRRVVVTGMGVLTSLGHDLGALWRNVVAGRSGVSIIERFDTTGFPVRIGAEVKDFDPAPYLEPADAAGMDLVAQFALAGCLRALEDAGLAAADLDPERTGVIVGTGAGAQTTVERTALSMHRCGPGAVGSDYVPMMLLNMAAAQVATRVGARGPTTAVATACSAGANAIGDGLRAIQEGEADVMICGGAEVAMHPLGVAGFCAARALSTRNDEPARASRPFDRDRNGFILGEGAGALVLEELGHARARGARIYAELAGYGSNSDAHHMTMPAPDGAGAAACMRRALRDAGVSAAEVGYINAHGTATKLGDVSETRAIKAVFGEAGTAPPCSSTKSMTGHLLGAAGAVEAVVTILALAAGTLPPTINLEHPDPRCDLDYVPNAARRAQLRVAITNSFAFGGHNTTLVFRKT